MSRWRSLFRELLNMDLMRRLALPMRASNPKVYSLLNSMRKKVLAGHTDLAAYQANALARFNTRADLTGARVLEVGSDPELRVLRQMLARGVGEAVGVNNARELWTDRAEQEIVVDGARLLNADAANLPFPDGSFDYIFSVAVFEHLLDLPAALAEMRRVLAPHGLVYAAFGPIWSGCKGHHLSIRLGDQELRHFIPASNPLPDFCHLLLGPERMREALRYRVRAEWIGPIVDYVYHGTAINRLFHHEYVEAFAGSGLQLESLKPERDPVSPQLRRILELSYPSEHDFDVTNSEVILVKER